MLVQQAFMKFHLNITMMYLKNRDYSMKCTKKSQCPGIVSDIPSQMQKNVNVI